MTTTAGSLRHAFVWMFLIVTTAAATVAANGHPGAALAPAAAALIAFALVRLPLRHTAAAVLFVSLLAHNPGGRPMVDVWQGPLYDLGVITYNNLRHIVGLGALRFCALEVFLVALAAVAALRVLSPDDRDGTKGLKAALPLKVSLAISSLTLFALGAYGLATGGSFRQLLWQGRQLFWLPIVAAIFIVSFRTPASYRKLGAVVIAAAVLRSLEGLYFYLTVVRPRDLDLPYLLTHEDSVLFTVTLVILLASLLERPSRVTWWLNVLVTPLVTWALLMNGRRLAYVSIAGAALAVFVIVRRPLRRALSRLALVLAPAMILYVALGWSSSAPIFAPVASLRSVADEDNASNITRDIENRNLVYTIERSPLAGSGLGHPYEEVELGPSIERLMENYRYIAHNSVLWLWSIGGIIGFTLLWLPFTVAMFLAPRCYRATSLTTERVAVLASVAAIVAYVSQAYGDMGVTGWTATLLVGASFAVISTIATRRSAYPAV